MQKDKLIVGVLVVALLGALAYLIYDLVTMKSTKAVATSSSPTMEQFAAMHSSNNQNTHSTPKQNKAMFKNVHEGFEVPVAGEPVDQAETPKTVPGVLMPTGMIAGLPSECYPKDVLTSADLLPADANSLWAQVNPSGQGSLADQNFLTAGFHIGINTVGQSLRNANRQLRSEPANPQIAVSPWLNSTIEPDLMRQPLEIGCGSP
jgi:hypothetical protein